MVHKLCFISACLILSTQFLRGQNLDSHESHLGMGQVETIDGAKNPELITDSTAYRLFFVVVGVGSNPSDEDRARQEMQVTKIGLNDPDTKVLVAMVNDFKLAYDAAMTDYNNNAEALQVNGQLPDSAAFIQQRDLLIEKTLAKLNSALTPIGSAKLNSYIQGEKRNMKIVRPRSH